MLLFFLIGILFATSWDVAHDFHVSRCEIVYRSETMSLEITQHMFADDVEVALLQLLERKEAFHLSTEIERDGAEEALKPYLADHTGVTINGKQIPLTYLGREPGEDNAAMWVYIEGVNCPVPLQVVIRYDLLCETFPDQKNIVSFQVDNGEKQMFLLDRSNPEVSFSI
jgi:hypothetical protein